MLLVALVMLGVQSCDRRPRAVPIQIGQSIQGRLEAGDWTDVFADGSFADLYEVTLRAGQSVTVEMTSSDLDSYLSLLRGPGDQLADNDDIAPGNRDSRLSYTAQAAGTYYIAATSFRSGATGAYTLRVTATPARSEEGSAKTQ